MTRRRFQHCRNEKCNRRLDELLERPEDPPPPARLCEACLELQSRTEAESYQRGHEDGHRAGLSLGTLRGVVIVLALEVAVVGFWLAWRLLA